MNHPSEPKRRRSPGALAAILISVFALTVALSSTATAALMIGSNQIKKNAVQSKHIKKNAVKSADIKNGTIKNRDLSAATRNGLAGPQGEQGPQGEKGDRGATGFGLTGPKGDKGDPGLSGYTHVDRSFNLSPAASSTNPYTLSGSVVCPAGTKALSGGFQVTPGDIDVRHSRPATTNDREWIVGVANYGTTSGTLDIHAVCAAVAD